MSCSIQLNRLPDLLMPETQRICVVVSRRENFSVNRHRALSANNQRWPSAGVGNSGGHAIIIGGGVLGCGIDVTAIQYLQMLAPG
jgi:hypothetical protein